MTLKAWPHTCCRFVLRVQGVGGDVHLQLGAGMTALTGKMELTNLAFSSEGTATGPAGELMRGAAVVCAGTCRRVCMFVRLWLLHQIWACSLLQCQVPGAKIHVVWYAVASRTEDNCSWQMVLSAAECVGTCTLMAVTQTWCVRPLKCCAALVPTAGLWQYTAGPAGVPTTAPLPGEGLCRLSGVVEERLGASFKCRICCPDECKPAMIPWPWPAHCWLNAYCQMYPHMLVICTDLHLACLCFRQHDAQDVHGPQQVGSPKVLTLPILPSLSSR